jgi:poly(A) polymerase
MTEERFRLPAARGAGARRLRKGALGIAQRLQKAGFEAFWVGGAVRDLLLGREPDDYDFATSALAGQTAKLFQRTIGVGRKFGVMLVVEGGHEFQVATFRGESHYRDGRRPGRVQFGDAKADARRRDFTINGLFFDPVTKTLRDWVGGRVDIEAKVIRTIGSPRQRFKEDHLRMLRAVRLAAQLGFSIERHTLAALKSSATKIRRVSPERIRDELIKLFQPPHAARGLELLEQSGLLRQVLPEIASTVGCEQSPDYHPEGDVFQHLLLMLSYLPADSNSSLAWAALLHDVAKPRTAARDPKTGIIHFYGHERVGAEMAKTLLERLRFPRKQVDEIVAAVHYHMQFKDVFKMKTATLRRMLMRPTFPLELELHRLDSLGSDRRLDVYDFLVRETRALEEKPHLVPPLITGNDLIELGMKPGREMGKLLHEIREKQLQDELRTKDQARKWAKGRLNA